MSKVAPAELITESPRVISLKGELPSVDALPVAQSTGGQLMSRSSCLSRDTDDVCRSARSQVRNPKPLHNKGGRNV